MARHRQGESRVVAVAAGFGPDWYDATEAGADDLEMRLVQDVPIEGHVLDHRGPTGLQVPTLRW